MPILENDALKITVADRGAEPVSVWDKENGCERLWTASRPYGTGMRRSSFPSWEG